MLPDPIDRNAILPWENEGAVRAAPKDAPGISVVVPIFNAGAFLEKTIRSLLCQDLRGVELIVMDGASTDDTPRILEYYQEYLSVWVSEADSGQSNAINKGFRRASKPLLHWLNGDDLLLPGTLSRVREEFADNRDCDFLVGDAYMTEQDLTPIRHCTYSEEAVQFDHLLNYAFNHLVQPSVFFTQRAWAQAGPLDETLHYAMDADLFLGMAAKFRARYLPVDMAYSVYHEQCKTRGRRGESIAELAVVQARHGGYAEARETLNLLVEMYNDANAQLEGRAGTTQDKVEAADKNAACARCEVAEKTLRAYREELDEKRAELLTMDLELT